MYKLNLETKSKEQELIKEYLENNVSELVADKINNGVKITKDNKTLINKKDLVGFMKYATEEARKQVEKGANSACIHSDMVFGWAMHYFEEDAIEGILYNEDGTEFKPANKTTAKAISKPEIKKETSKQSTLFDFMLDDKKEETNTIENNEEIEKQEEIIENTQKTHEKCEKTTKISEIYEKYHEQELSYPNIVVLTRVGDFYEAYNENAERIADILDLVITSKDVGLDSKVKLAGFPFHVKENYFKRINDKFNILVIENDEITFVDTTQNEIKTETSETQTFDKYTLKTIASLLDGKVIMK